MKSALVPEISTGRWTRSTPFLDLANPRLRIRAKSIAQLCNSERDKAVAIHGFVQGIAFGDPFSRNLKRPSEVLGAGVADAQSKAALMVALLRLNGIAARIRYLVVDGRVLQGLVSRCGAVARPVVEVWLNTQWVQTDTYIFDPAYVNAAKAALERRGWSLGYGVHRDDPMLWDGASPWWFGHASDETASFVVADHGAYDDPMAYRSNLSRHAAASLRSRGVQLAREAHLLVLHVRAVAGLKSLRSGKSAAVGFA